MVGPCWRQGLNYKNSRGGVFPRRGKVSARCNKQIKIQDNSYHEKHNLVSNYWSHKITTSKKTCSLIPHVIIILNMIKFHCSTIIGVIFIIFVVPNSLEFFLFVDDELWLASSILCYLQNRYVVHIIIFVIIFF